MYRVETEREDDGHWIAEVADLPGVLAYGTRGDEAVRRVQALTLRVRAEPGVADPLGDGPEGRPAVVAGLPGRR